MNEQFFIGVIVDICIIGFLTFEIPLYFTGVKQELLKQNHGYYDPNSGNFKLYDMSKIQDIERLR